MIPTFTQHPPSSRHSRIGRKALHADRLASVLVASQSTQKRLKAKRSWRLSSVQPKFIAIASISAIVIIAAAVVGLNYFSVKAQIAQKAAAVEQQVLLKAKSEAADACRRKIAEQKADQIGKITYDELYNYGECDK